MVDILTQESAQSRIMVSFFCLLLCKMGVFASELFWESDLIMFTKPLAQCLACIEYPTLENFLISVNQFNFSYLYRIGKKFSNAGIRIFILKH